MMENTLAVEDSDRFRIQPSDRNEWIIRITPPTDTEPAKVELNPAIAYERAVERFVETVNQRLAR